MPRREIVGVDESGRDADCKAEPAWEKDCEADSEDDPDGLAESESVSACVLVPKRSFVAEEDGEDELDEDSAGIPLCEPDAVRVKRGIGDPLSVDAAVQLLLLVGDGDPERDSVAEPLSDDDALGLGDILGVILAVGDPVSVRLTVAVDAGEFVSVCVTLGDCVPVGVWVELGVAEVVRDVDWERDAVWLPVAVALGIGVCEGDDDWLLVRL